MVSLITFLTNFLLASVAFAVPTPGLATGSSHSRRMDSQSRSVNRTEAPVSEAVEYTPNWAGAGWETAEDTFSFITGSFEVPLILGSPGWGFDIRIGIFGFPCTTTTTSFHAGVIGYINDDYVIEYKAFYESPTAFTSIFPDFRVNVGDEITINIAAETMTAEVGIINKSTGQSAVQTFSYNGPLCRKTALWLVEGFRPNEDIKIVDLADFTQVEFTDVIGYDLSGDEYKALNPTIFDMVVDHKNATYTFISELDDTITVQYIL